MKRRRIDWGRIGFLTSLLLPAVLLYYLLVLWPMAQSFWVALHRWRGVSGRMTFVGPENFLALAGDERFRGAVGHNLQFFVMVAVVVLALGLYFAHLLSQSDVGPTRLRGAGVFRSLFLFPNVVSAAAVSILWLFLYNPNWGLLNAAAQLLRLQPAGGGTVWLTGSTALPAVAVSFVWYVLGFYILLLRAGMGTIPLEIGEAARIDGAGEWQRFWSVTVPMLSGLIRLVVIHVLISSMNLFALVWIMAPPSGTAGNTEVALTYLYQKGFVESQFGYSTAIGAANFVIVMGVTTLIQKLWKTE